jgi:hypothetical protein
MLVIAEKFGFTYPLNDALKVIDSEIRDRVGKFGYYR